MTRLILSALFLVAVLSVSARADDKNEHKDKTVKMGDVPSAVQKTFKREAEGNTFKEVDVEGTGDNAVYEAEFMMDNHEYQMEVTADGTLLCKTLEANKGKQKNTARTKSSNPDVIIVEEAIDTINVKQLPDAVMKTLQRESKNGKILGAIRDNLNGVVTYEAAVDWGDMEYDIQISEDGTLIAKFLEAEFDNGSNQSNSHKKNDSKKSSK